jgi:peptidyl-dipeptidase Dcp
MNTVNRTGISNNPLFAEWDTPYGSPPFDKFTTGMYKPAIEEAIQIALAEIGEITSNTEEATFDNIIAALDRSGELLNRISSVLFNLNSAETSRELQAVTQEVSPLLARFSNDITLNRELFSKVKHVYDKRASLVLDTEQMMLLEKSHRNFILGGAGLDEAHKARFREISEELSQLQVKFEENVLEETNSFELHITDRNDLSGLPEGVIEMASMEARNRHKDGWVITLHAPSYIPFMKYSESREMRETLLKAYSSRSFHNDSHDNRDLAARIASLRLEISVLLGFKNYAGLALVDRMAENEEKVTAFLKELDTASKPAAARDIDNVRKCAAGSGLEGNMERWDWAYYSEKLQKALFNFDDETLKPYFVLENAEKGIFSLAERLYGLKFIPEKNIPLYHPEVKTWKVLDSDGSFLAILYLDYFPRPGKNGGAWMTSFREQRFRDGSDIRPLVSIVANFSRPTETRPSLLTFNEVTTLLHEFGHSLHGMLSKCRYEGLSGTSVARDFVELPSQFMENYAFEKEWLSSWAHHYLTGEILPDHLIEKLKLSSTFNEGYACNRQLGFGFLDMAWHTITSAFDRKLEDFERETLKSLDLFPPLAGSNISVSFTHIFGGGYAAGYYGYKWAEVLDADAFELFKETGIFNSDTALSFRKNILEKGGTDKAMILYKAFRGKEPTLEPFLKRSGLI